MGRKRTSPDCQASEVLKAIPAVGQNETEQPHRSASLALQVGPFA